MPYVPATAPVLEHPKCAAIWPDPRFRGAQRRLSRKPWFEGAVFPPLKPAPPAAQFTSAGGRIPYFTGKTPMLLSPGLIPVPGGADRSAGHQTRHGGRPPRTITRRFSQNVLPVHCDRDHIAAGQAVMIFSKFGSLLFSRIFQC